MFYLMKAGHLRKAILQMRLKASFNRTSNDPEDEKRIKKKHWMSKAISKRWSWLYSGNYGMFRYCTYLYSNEGKTIKCHEIYFVIPCCNGIGFYYYHFINNIIIIIISSTRVDVTVLLLLVAVVVLVLLFIFVALRFSSK